MLVTIARLGWCSSSEPSDSSTSATSHFERPAREWLPSPTSTVGSRPASVRMWPVMCVTVVLPWLPPMAMDSAPSMISARASARVITRTPIARAASSSGESLMAPL